MKTRYYEHWGASSPVFVREREPGQVFWYPGLENVFENILQWTSVPGRVISLVGGPGSGKTTILREIYHRYPADWDVSAFIVTGWETDPLWLMGGMARFFGGDAGWENPDLQMKLVQEGIEQLREEGRHLLMLVDGVERLQRTDDLAVLRDLQEFCGDSISVLLVGQTLKYDQCDDQCTLEPWSLEATTNAIKWCLETAEMSHLDIHDDMFEGLFKRSKGVPGVLMRLAEGALITGAMCQTKVWSSELIPLDHASQEASVQKKKRARKPVAKMFEKKKKSP